MHCYAPNMLHIKPDHHTWYPAMLTSWKTVTVEQSQGEKKNTNGLLTNVQSSFHQVKKKKKKSFT